jgi:hypothetical protein
LISDARRWRLRCYERQLEVVDDAIHYTIVGDEGDDAHLALTFGANQGVCLINLAVNLGPALAGDSVALLFEDQELVVSFL